MTAAINSNQASPFFPLVLAAYQMTERPLISTRKSRRNIQQLFRYVETTAGLNSNCLQQKIGELI